jgi:hypothetical protein
MAINNFRKVMTSLFWRKRPSKKLTAVLLFLTVVLIVFFYRRPIAIKSIEHFAKPQNIGISCLDFSLDWRFNINIEKACITSPLGTAIVSNAMWQPWSNVFSIEQIKVKHLATDNKVEKEIPGEDQATKLNLPDSLPILSISSLDIDSFVLLQPLHLSVNTISSNELSITGDVNASVKMQQNSLVADLVWSLSDLTKWIPQVQKSLQDNAELLKDVDLDAGKIQTSLIFDGEVLSANSSLDLVSRFYVSNCPIDAVIEGVVLIDVDLSSLNISLDLSQLANDFSVLNCPLLQDYLAEDDLPQLSFVIPQKVSMDETQINLPNLQIIDRRNTNRSIVLNELLFKTTGEFDVNYNISIKQPILTKQIQAGMLDFKVQGSLSVDLINRTPEQSISLKIVGDNNQLVLSDLKMNSLFIENLTSKFSVHTSEPNQFVMEGTIHSSDIQVAGVNIAKTSSDFSLSGASFNDMQLSVANQIYRLDHSDASVQNISNHIDLKIKEFEDLSFSGNTTATKFSVQNINFQPITFTHTGQVSLANMTLFSQHEINLEQGFMIELEQQQTKTKVHINQQNLIGLQSVISQLENTLTVKRGNFSANIEFSLPQEGEQFVANGRADFQNVSAKYQDYVLNNITYQTPLTFDSAGLQLVESTLLIESIDVGVMIKQLQASVVAQDSVPRLTRVQGEFFNGKFSLADLWLDGREQQFNVNIQNVDLGQVVALQEQPGIQITGNIDGDLPLIMGKQGIRIEDGWISSLTGGKLTIVDNPSFDSIKLQQPDLALLENLDFTNLESSIKLNPDGEMFFDFSLKGNNPDKKQAVNFNYNHQQNLLALLELKRLIKSVENKIEQKITQGDKK